MQGPPQRLGNISFSVRDIHGAPFRSSNLLRVHGKGPFGGFGPAGLRSSGARQKRVSGGKPAADSSSRASRSPVAAGRARYGRLGGERGSSPPCALGDEVREGPPEEAGELEELDRIDAPLPCFALRDEELRPSHRGGGFLLGQAGCLTR